jgi:hypothetical protein
VTVAIVGELENLRAATKPNLCGNFLRSISLINH